MRALIIFTVLLLNQTSFGQDTSTAPAATAAPQTSSTPEIQPVPSTSDIEEEAAAPKEPIRSGFLLNPNFTMASRKLDFDPTQEGGKFRTVQLDTKVGYVFDFGLFAGAQINYAVGNAQTNGSGGTDTDTNSYTAGPTIGYNCNLTGLFLTATYHMVGSTNITGAGKYTKATGYQIDLGYPMKINDNVKLGPQLSLKRIDLEEGSAGLADTEIKELTPYFGLWLYF